MLSKMYYRYARALHHIKFWRAHVVLYWSVRYMCVQLEIGFIEVDRYLVMQSLPGYYVVGFLQC